MALKAHPIKFVLRIFKPKFSTICTGFANPCAVWPKITLGWKEIAILNLFFILYYLINMIFLACLCPAGIIFPSAFLAFEQQPSIYCLSDPHDWNDWRKGWRCSFTQLGPELSDHNLYFLENIIFFFEWCSHPKGKKRFEFVLMNCTADCFFASSTTFRLIPVDHFIFCFCFPCLSRIWCFWTQFPHFWTLNLWPWSNKLLYITCRFPLLSAVVRLFWERERERRVARMASRRIIKELKDLQRDPPTSCSAGESSESWRSWISFWFPRFWKVNLNLFLVQVLFQMTCSTGKPLLWVLMIVLTQGAFSLWPFISPQITPLSLQRFLQQIFFLDSEFS